MPARTGSALAAAWAASRIRAQTGSTDRGSATFLTSALSIWRSPSTGRDPCCPSRSIDTPPARTLRRLHYKTSALGRGPSALGAGLQLVDQRFDLAAVVLDVGIEIGTSSHDHADALDLHVGNAQAPAGGIAYFPFEL